MDISQLMYLGVPVAGIIIGLVELVKGLGLPTRLAPLVAVIFGLLAGGIGFYATQDYNYFGLGLISGLLACGLYPGIKASVGK